MSFVDKVKNEAQKYAGTAKEQIGKLTGNKDQQAQGSKDQTKGDLKQAGENVKDAFKK